MNYLKRKKINISSKLLSNTSKTMILLILLICGIGLITLYSASLHVNLSFFQKVIGKQVIWMMLGSIVALLLFFVQKKILYEQAYTFYWIGLVLIILPYFFGSSSTGTSRWLSFSGINFQPSELMKIIIVIAVAKYLANSELHSTNFRVFIVPVIITLIPTAIILKQPDLGTSMILIMAVFPMLFWAGTRLFHIFIFIAPVLSIITAFNFYTFFLWVVVLILVLYFSQEKIVLIILLFLLNLSLGFTTPIMWNNLHTYQQNRILTLLDVESDPQGAGYQVIQSQVAIGSGGLMGKGIGRGTQTHLKFLPEQHTDFIFSVVGEEGGFIAVLIVLSLYFLLILLCFQTAYKIKDKFSSLVIVGLTSVILFHIVINVAMTVGLMPVTGLPLPFLSYGGSFILTCFIIVGLILNLSIEKSRY